ncbi:MAG: hypothetical protein K6F99_10970 [Lachnospiraceae bacterium]|nr:hypothetical protein [Lachnospiraceae bacterium]
MKSEVHSKKISDKTDNNHDNKKASENITPNDNLQLDDDELDQVSGGMGFGKVEPRMGC